MDKGPSLHLIGKYASRKLKRQLRDSAPESIPQSPLEVPALADTKFAPSGEPNGYRFADGRGSRNMAEGSKPNWFESWLGKCAGIEWRLNQTHLC